MINYNWDCKTVDVYPSQNDNADVVYNVHWGVTGEDDKTLTTSNSIGTQVLNTESITEFIPFEDLTNDQIVEWTKATMGEDQVAAIEGSIAKQIAEKENPTSVTMHIEK